MASLLWFPIERTGEANATTSICSPDVIIDTVDQLDASIRHVHRLLAASGTPVGTPRAEALGLRLAAASLREAMHAVSSGNLRACARGAETLRAWETLEPLVEHLVSLAACLSEPGHPADEHHALRVRLEATCRSTLASLHRLRVLVVGIYGMTDTGAAEH